MYLHISDLLKECLNLGNQHSFEKGEAVMNAEMRVIFDNHCQGLPCVH
jgi:hypothetical protein